MLRVVKHWRKREENKENGVFNIWRSGMGAGGSETGGRSIGSACRGNGSTCRSNASAGRNYARNLWRLQMSDNKSFTSIVGKDNYDCLDNLYFFFVVSFAPDFRRGF